MPNKKVLVTVRQGSGFRAEAEVGKHKVIIDQPAAGGGTDAGPTPLDYQVVALGACIGAVGRIIAMQRRLDIRGIRVDLEGTINTDGVLGKPSTDRVGFSSITAVVTLDCDLPRAEQEKLLHEIDKRCPISDSLTRPVRVTVKLAD